MKALFLHCSSIYFKPITKAIPNAEKVKKEAKEVKDCLVIFTAVEEGDNESCVKQLVEEVEKVANQIKVNNFVVYPYVHLTSRPSNADLAYKLLVSLEKNLKKLGKVYRAPFGWYKEFRIDVKGHPLAELSREIKAQEESSQALKAEKKAKSYWYILDLSGKLHRIKFEKDKLVGFDFSHYKNLEKFVEYEMKKVRAVSIEPPHVKIMRGLEYVDYEQASDPGNLRFYYKGRLIKSLIEEFVTRKMLEYGALEVETPLMYDFNHPALKTYLNKFPARQYTIITPNKKVFLRFAACFGQFIMASQANISYRHLPLKLYELAKSFRVEQRGELVGLKRLRVFTMPDCHCLCKDIDQAKEEMKIRFLLAKEILESIGFDVKKDFELAIRVTKDFWKKHSSFIKSFVKLFGKPALIEMWDRQYFYFCLKYELNFVDNLNKAAALTTDQIDVGNAKNYGITYIDKSNKRKNPVILHLSPSGAIERVIYALLEKAYMDEKNGKKPMLPYWLCPTQVRIIPVSEKYVNEAIEFAEDLNAHNEARADVDDRNLHVSKKILEAEKEWIPYIIVIGERELKEQMLTVRIRENNSLVTMSPSEFRKLIKEKQGNMPFKRIPVLLLSKRPSFR
jgi:threonyl-tRNA synthetase